jgi:hypothetical protein
MVLVCAVVYHDGDTEHLTLQQGRYKVLEGAAALPPKPRSASKSKAEASSPGQGPASAAAAAAKQRQATIPLAGSKPPGSKPGSKAASGGSTGGGGGQGATSAGAAVENGKLDTAGRGLGRDDRERRGSGSGEKEKDRALRDANGAAGGGAVGKKVPALNMSHVSKKDREAARMLLGFSTPTAQEVRWLFCFCVVCKCRLGCSAGIMRCGRQGRGKAAVCGLHCHHASCPCPASFLDELMQRSSQLDV